MSDIYNDLKNLLGPKLESALTEAKEFKEDIKSDVASSKTLKHLGKSLQYLGEKVIEGGRAARHLAEPLTSTASKAGQAIKKAFDNTKGDYHKAERTEQAAQRKEEAAEQLSSIYKNGAPTNVKDAQKAMDLLTEFFLDELGAVNESDLDHEERTTLLHAMAEHPSVMADVRKAITFDAEGNRVSVNTDALREILDDEQAIAGRTSDEGDFDDDVEDDKGMQTPPLYRSMDGKETAKADAPKESLKPSEVNHKQEISRILGELSTNPTVRAAVGDISENAKAWFDLDLVLDPGSVHTTLEVLQKRVATWGPETTSQEAQKQIGEILNLPVNSGDQPGQLAPQDMSRGQNIIENLRTNNRFQAALKEVNDDTRSEIEAAMSSPMTRDSYDFLQSLDDAARGLSQSKAPEESVRRIESAVKYSSPAKAKKEATRLWNNLKNDEFFNDVWQNHAVDAMEALETRMNNPYTTSVTNRYYLESLSDRIIAWDRSESPEELGKDLRTWALREGIVTITPDELKERGKVIQEMISNLAKNQTLMDALDFGQGERVLEWVDEDVYTDIDALSKLKKLQDLADSWGPEITAQEAQDQIIDLGLHRNVNHFAQ